MLHSLASASVLRMVSRALFGGLSVINVITLIASSSLEEYQIIQLTCIVFGIISVSFYMLDVARLVRFHQTVALGLLFLNSCAVALLFDFNPTPIYIFIPSFLCSIVVLNKDRYIRLFAVGHVLATVACYFIEDGTVDSGFYPSMIFMSIVGIVLIVSKMEESANRKYFFEVKALQGLLENKRLATKMKSDMLKEQNEMLEHTHGQLGKRIAENASRVSFLTSANEELGQIASAASRDIKAPLVKIESHVEKLGSRLHLLQQGGRISQYLDFVSDGASRMTAMVDDLLKYCDPSVRPNSTKVDSSEVLKVIEENLSNLLLRENARIVVEPYMPVILGHQTEILQLFQNLISNGIKFRKPGTDPVCRVGFTQDESEVCFYVKDNGIGIPKDRVKEVFGLFTRLHEHGSYEGTGIGLALCRRIVLSAGGKIWAESVEGEGTTFRFTWPLVNAGASSEPVRGLVSA